MLSLRTFNIFTLDIPPLEGSHSMKRTFVDTGEVIAGILNVADPGFAAMSEGQYGKVFRFFSDRVDSILKIGDRLSGAEEIFEVKGVNRQVDAPLRRLEAVVVSLMET